MSRVFLSVDVGRAPHARCPLLAQSGHALVHYKCPLSVRARLMRPSDGREYPTAISPLDAAGLVTDLPEWSLYLQYPSRHIARTPLASSTALRSQAGPMHAWRSIFRTA